MTPEQKAVIAFIIEDPDAWYVNIVTTFGQAEADIAVAKKVDRWQPAYDAAVAAGTYLTRVEREAAALLTPEYLAEQDRIAALEVVRQKKMQSFLDNLPTRAAVKTAINAAFPDAKQNKIVTRLADVVYWLAKNTEE